MSNIIHCRCCNSFILTIRQPQFHKLKNLLLVRDAWFKIVQPSRICINKQCCGRCSKLGEKSQQFIGHISRRNVVSWLLAYLRRALQDLPLSTVVETEHVSTFVECAYTLNLSFKESIVTNCKFCSRSLSFT